MGRRFMHELEEEVNEVFDRICNVLGRVVQLMG